MNLLNYTKRYFESKILIFLFLAIYLLSGIFIFKDYGISFDENINRFNGFVSLKYIFQKLGVDINLSLFVNNLPNLADYVDKAYGVAFDLPVALFEVILKLSDSQQVYFFKHLINFLIFFSSSVVFYFLLKNIFKNNIISLFGLFFLISSPRIFAESFYNPKDIILMSFFIFAIFFNIKFLQENNNKYIILASLFSALAIDVRIIAIYLPLLTLFFLFFNGNNKNLNEKLTKFFKYIVFFILFFILFWPWMWDFNFYKLITSLAEFKNYPWNGEVLYFGNFLKAKFLPWHYFFVWFFITTPIIFFLIITMGLFRSLLIFFENLINIEKINYYNLWKNKNEMILVFILFVFLIPVVSVIFFNSTLYNGWRQLYFLYPSLIILGLYFLEHIRKHKNKYIFRIISLILVLQILFNFFYISKHHPHQHVYFNILSKNFVKNNFPIDYWGVSNRETLERILKNNEFIYPLKISTASFTDLNKTKLIINENLREKFIFIEDDHDNADLIFTNYYYFVRPIYNKKRYNIPNHFQSFYKLRIEGMTINEIFINKKKFSN